ncbi:hypothetical protein JNUCC1_02492 [Lentibacillus sp. JNUCC-1]|uniref:hypothetical protein n=1 Tax=Lentibacillus sp. JNUCC-1 TaxID=2654513 RepID=UPI0012E7820E|nr:hypothetical protein [Lentibacillus sp. JNUCC-1]MUV38638.1 hypothetical protein [Lentibacillus sp. JNUCC-1]
MPAAWVLKSIAVLAGSIAAGFVFYMLLSALGKQERKQMMEDVLGSIINFIIYIWLGKILLNLPTMFGDPFAVLAYPSDSKAFYLATLFSAVHIAIKVYKGKLNAWSHLHALLYVLVGAMFTFEFIGMATEDGDSIGEFGPVVCAVVADGVSA